VWKGPIVFPVYTGLWLWPDFSRWKKEKEKEKEKD
jgi:hypothetical protein